MVVVIIEYPHYFKNVLLVSKLLSEDFEMNLTTIKYMFAIDFVYVTLIAVIKISILIMYRRVFKSVFMKRGTLILGVITGLWWLSIVLVATFQCIPVRASFDIEAAKNAKCIAKHAYFLTNGIPNIITDALILCLPILEIRRLQVKTSQRLAIAAAFLLGILVVIASICRLVSVVDLFEGPDLTRKFMMTLEVNTRLSRTFADCRRLIDRASNFLIWNSVECNVAIMSATLPQMRPVLHWLLQVVGYTKPETTLPTTNNSGSAAPFQPLKEEGTPNTKSTLRVQERKTNSPGLNDQSEKRQSYWARLKGYGNEGSDSELPLHAIKVTHEVAWKVENKEGRELSSSRMNESDRQPLRHYESDNEMRGQTPPGSGPTSNGYDYDIRKMENNFI